MKNIKIFLFALVLFVSQLAPAQNSIIDLSVIPLVPDSAAPTGMVDVAFEVKIQHPQNLQSIIIMVGTQQDDASLYMDSVQIVTDTAGYATLHNSQYNHIESYQARWTCRLSEIQWSQYDFITVYGRLFNAVETTRLYWEKVSL